MRREKWVERGLAEGGRPQSQHTSYCDVRVFMVTLNRSVAWTTSLAQVCISCCKALNWLWGCTGGEGRSHHREERTRSGEAARLGGTQGSGGEGEGSGEGNRTNPIIFSSPRWNLTSSSLMEVRIVFSTCWNAFDTRWSIFSRCLLFFFSVACLKCSKNVRMGSLRGESSARKP